MISKGKRLNRDLFKNLQGSRRFFHSEHFTLRTADSPAGTRVGVSVSKKVAKKAVMRNRIRRRAYSVIRDFLPNLPKSLFLIVAKPGAEMLKCEALRSELAELLKKG